MKKALAVLALICALTSFAKENVLNTYYEALSIARATGDTYNAQLFQKKIKFVKKKFNKVEHKWVNATTPTAYDRLLNNLIRSLQVSSDKSELRAESVAYPKFDAKKYEEEYQKNNKNTISEKYTEKKLDQVKKEAENAFKQFKKGDIITVRTKMRSYTGEFFGYYGAKVKIGPYWVPTIDLPRSILEKMQPNVIKRRRQEYVNKNFFQARTKEMNAYNSKMNYFVNSERKKFLTEKSEKMIDFWYKKYSIEVSQLMSDIDTGLCSEFEF